MKHPDPTDEPTDDDLREALRALDGPAPPTDFADRVLAARGDRPAAAAPPPRGRVRAGVFVAGALALAAGVALFVRDRQERGEVTADASRVEARLGRRARVVAEPGAHLAFRGDDVTQDRGDVFYRVEPGERFVVHTPVGDVDVLGTCFRVRLDAPGDDEMAKRDVAKVGGAAVLAGVLATAATVTVYEGRVGVSRASAREELAAGERAALDAEGVRKLDPESAGRGGATGSLAPRTDETVEQANARLVAAARDTRRELEAVSSQRTALEARLKEAEARLEAIDGGARLKHDFDLDAEDWKTLAANGSVKYAVPCDKVGWSPSPEALDKLGLAPTDAEPIRDAYARSRERMWKTMRPLCLDALKNPELVDKLGPDKCSHMVIQVAQAADAEASYEAMREVARIRAGEAAPPADLAKAHPVLRTFLALTGESRAFEGDLAQTFGPEDAKRIAFGEGLCRSSSTWGGPPRGKP